MNTLSSQSQSEAKPPSLVIGSYKALVHTERRRKTLNPSKRQTSSHPTQSPLTLSIVDLANATSLSLCGSALESNCFELYWASLLPNAVTFPRCAERYSTAGWANVVQGLILKDGFDVLRLALRANALTLVGQQHANQAIIAEGWRSYGASLQMLAKLVSRRTRDVQMSEKLLSAAMLLSQYEVHNFKSYTYLHGYYFFFLLISLTLLSYCKRSLELFCLRRVQHGSNML